MNLKKLSLVLEGEPRFRFKQVEKAVFQDLISNWDDNTTLPLSLREKLNSECPLEIDAEVSDSTKSESAKALITLEDGLKIETVLMHHKDGRNTVCVSTQVGCALACTFCATGKMGFKRNLTTGEIVSQVLFFSRYLKKRGSKDTKPVSNVVFMGMGEPFLNYENVMEAIKIINDKEKINIGARHISVSTAGVIEGIKKFTKEKLQINLAISLHAPNDKLRQKLMPIAKNYPLEKLMTAVGIYAEKRSRQVMFEYLMIDGVNDSERCAKELGLLMDHPLYVVNLIPCNPTGVYNPSSSKAIKIFANILLRARVKVTQRHSFGRDIKGACGQLAGEK